MAYISPCGELEDLGAGGLLQLTQHLVPVAYSDEGVLKAIEYDWEATGNPNYPVAVSKAPMIAYSTPDCLQRFCPTREPDRYFELGPPFVKIGGEWTQVELSDPVTDGSLLKWTKTQANLYLQFGGHYMKLAILLKDGWVPEDGMFAFPVALNGLTRTGLVLYADGSPVMRFRKLVVYDYANPDDVRDIEQEIVNVGGTHYLLLTLPDLSGMSQPLIDPTLTIQPDATAGVDTCIFSNYPTSNFGTNAAFEVGEDKDSTSVRRGLIRFDLSTLPSGATVSSATLSLWINLDRSSNARTFRVYRQKRAWVEAQATWNIYSTGNNWATAGGFGAADCEQTDIGTASYTASESAGFKDYTLTPTTKAGLDYGVEQGGSETGWLIKADTETDDGYRHDSSDSATAAQRPKLVLVYSMPGGGNWMLGGWGWSSCNG